MELFSKLVLLLLIITNTIYCRGINDEETMGSTIVDKLDMKKLVYLNVTVIYNADNTSSLEYDLIPIAETGFEDYQRYLADATYQDADIPNTTSGAGYLSGAIENFLKVLPTVPNFAAETVGSLFGEVYGLLGINITKVRTAPLGTATQAINNVAFCNPLFAGVNAGRCRGFFMATP